MQANRVISKEKQEEIMSVLETFADPDVAMLNEIIERLVEKCPLPYYGLENERGAIAVLVFEAFYKDRDKIVKNGIGINSYFYNVLKRCSFNVLCELHGVSNNDYNYYLTIDKIRIHHQIPLYEGNAYKISRLCDLTIPQVLRGIEAEKVIKSLSYDEKHDCRSTENPFDYRENETVVNDDTDD